MIEQELREQIVYIADHVDDLAIMTSYIKLRPINDIYRSRCPFHNEKTPSFTVYPKGFINNKKEQQHHLTYYCFGCGTSGNIVTFVNKIEHHHSLEETCQFFQNKYGVIYGEDERLIELKQQLQRLSQSQPNIMSINELNIRCSSWCRQYLFEVIEDYPYLFNQEFEYLQELYKWLDKEFNQKSAVELQDIYAQVMEKIRQRKTILEK